MSRYTTQKPANKPLGLIHVLILLFMIGLLIFFANAFLTKIKKLDTATTEEINQIHNSNKMIPGGIVIQADNAGHFRGTVFINGYPMPFVIDTGATTTVIPVKMAAAAGLPFGRSVPVDTAGGRVFDQATRLDSLKIGTGEIRNLSASINQHLDEVLVGMSTLKYFHMTQESNTLTLVLTPYRDQVSQIESNLTASQPIQQIQPVQVTQPLRAPQAPNYQAAAPIPDTYRPTARTTWKKSVSCGSSGCKTSYK
ncbi:MAG: TIGR02281 family clan AA aspartic protease [Methylobacter sp.]